MISVETPEAPASTEPAHKRIRKGSKAAKKEKTPATVSQLALDVVSAAEPLGIVAEWKGGHTVRIPAWGEFKKTLPEGERGMEMAKTFFALEEACAILTGGGASTWVIRPSGCFALYGKFYR